LSLFAVPCYRDEKVSLEQQLNMKAKQRQTTKEEIRKIKAEIEEVCLSGLADDQNKSCKMLARVVLSSVKERMIKMV